MGSIVEELGLRRLVGEQDEYVRQTRRRLHRGAELSGREFQTSAFLKGEARALGLEVEEVPGVGGTGFIATLDTGRPGRTVCLRADIDALPITESPNNLVGPKPCVSENEGACHACGHDGHMAMLLGAMRALCSIRDSLRGRVLFAFEEGEEVGYGIRGMLAALAPKGVDVVYGTHLAAFLDAGTVEADAGPVMAAACSVDLTVRGRGGHGSRPDQAINPIFAAAQVLSGISSAWNNQVAVDKTVTLGISTIHAGAQGNIIPDDCRITGSLRYFDVEEGRHAYDVLRNVATLTARAHRCTVEFGEGSGPATVPVVNDPGFSAVARCGFDELFPGALTTGVRWYASDSFSRYPGAVAPSVYAFVGVRNERIGTGAPHHTPEFDIDEDALVLGTGGAVAFACNVLLGE